MHGLWTSFVAEVSPGVALALVGLVALVPPYVVLRRSDRGRARSAVSYLCGLAAGLAATVLLAAQLGAFTDTDAVIAAGLLSSFVCPFLGLARAKWEGPRKRSRRVAIPRGAAPQS